MATHNCGLNGAKKARRGTSRFRERPRRPMPEKKYGVEKSTTVERIEVTEMGAKLMWAAPLINAPIIPFQWLPFCTESKTYKSTTTAHLYSLLIIMFHHCSILLRFLQPIINRYGALLDLALAALIVPNKLL